MIGLRTVGWSENSMGQIATIDGEHALLVHGLYDPDVLKGQIVSIEGAPYRVRAVEYMAHHTPEDPNRKPFNLLVEAVPAVPAHPPPGPDSTTGSLDHLLWRAFETGIDYSIDTLVAPGAGPRDLDAAKVEHFRRWRASLVAKP